MKNRANPMAERQILPFAEWSASHQQAWENARRPSIRLKKGGAGSHLAPESLDDYPRLELKWRQTRMAV
jgi:hypothetical protein